MQRPGKIEDVKKTIHTGARKVFQHGLGDSFWTVGGGRREFGATNSLKMGENQEE